MRELRPRATGSTSARLNLSSNRIGTEADPYAKTGSTGAWLDLSNNRIDAEADPYGKTGSMPVAACGFYYPISSMEMGGGSPTKPRPRIAETPMCPSGQAPGWRTPPTGRLLSVAG